MSFSIVIPTHNSSSFIREALDSVSKSTSLGGYEVILVDDCSPDIQELRRIVDEYSFVRLIEKSKKSNAAHSRNIGLQASLFDSVFFLDSDDHMLSGTIERRLEMHKRDSFGVIFGNYINKHDDFELQTNFPPYLNGDFRDYLFQLRGDVRSSTISICKSVWKGSLFDEASFKHQDWIFMIRAADEGERIGFDTTPAACLYTSRTERMSATMNVSASRYFCDKYLVKREHRNMFSYKHWPTIIANRDTKAARFFLSIYRPRRGVERLKLTCYRLACLPVNIIFTSLLLKGYRAFKNIFR